MRLLFFCYSLLLVAGLTRANDRPNFIVVQPDDLRFFEEWTPPPHYPSGRTQVETFPNGGLPNIERLRVNGLQMMESYT